MSGNTKQQTWRHFQTHVSEIVECEECPQEFVSNKKMKDHMRKVHVAKTLSCEQCDNFFKQMYRLNEHIDAEHGGSVTIW